MLYNSCFTYQHSPILGHLASSHTVANLRPRKSSFSFAKFLPTGILVFNQGGNLSRPFSPFSNLSWPSYVFHVSFLRIKIELFRHLMKILCSHGIWAMNRSLGKSRILPWNYSSYEIRQVRPFSNILT